MAHEIADALVQWFARHGRSYPWRGTTDPWAILVSEVMLQQTTIPTVLARYEGWMQRFPTPAALAEATEQEALRSWEGLGYYRRVRALQATARAIQAEHGGRFPTDEAALRALPGIGDYTVGAVLSFAYNRPAPLVDANVARVLARVYNDRTPVDSPAGRRLHWAWAAELVHPTHPREYNSALMELGQTLCTPTQPQCLLCPIRAYCRAEQPETLPVRLPKQQITRQEHWDVWWLGPEGLLMEKQADHARHAGMYRLPRRSRDEVAALPLICDQSYSITRYRMVRHLHRALQAPDIRPGEEFIAPHDLASIPMASPDRKLILKLLG